MFETVRLYKFYSKKSAFRNLGSKKLKVSLLHELNDPFEMSFLQLPNAEQRAAWKNTMDQLWSDKGLICFSDRWSNPVMWSHYAENHKGLCLGVDVPMQYVTEVKYVRRREKVDFEALSLEDRAQAIEGFTHTKFSHWRYENEFRMFPSLGECEKKDGMYFLPFGKLATLKEIIIGPLSEASSAEIKRIVGPNVKVITSRLAFRTFSVCKQRRKDLQK